MLQIGDYMYVHVETSTSRYCMEPSTLDVSLGPEICQLGYAVWPLSSTNPPVSASPVLGLQCTCHTWLLYIKLGSFTFTLPTKPSSQPWLSLEWSEQLPKSCVLSLSKLRGGSLLEAVARGLTQACWAVLVSVYFSHAPKAELIKFSSCVSFFPAAQTRAPPHTHTPCTYLGPVWLGKDSLGLNNCLWACEGIQALR